MARTVSWSAGSSIEGGWEGPTAYQPIGDVNGDGIDDMLLAAPGTGFSSPPDTYGQVYLIFGQPEASLPS